MMRQTFEYLIHWRKTSPGHRASAAVDGQLPPRARRVTDKLKRIAVHFRGRRGDGS